MLTYADVCLIQRPSWEKVLDALSQLEESAAAREGAWTQV
jgi:hypothetical protein